MEGNGQKPVRRQRKAPGKSPAARKAGKGKSAPKKNAEPKVLLWQADPNDPSITAEQRKRILNAKHNRNQRLKKQAQKESPAIETQQVALKREMALENSEIQKLAHVEQFNDNDKNCRQQISNGVTVTRLHPCLIGKEDVMWSPAIPFKGVDQVKKDPGVALMNLVCQL